MPTPKPNRPSRRSRTGRPIMAALDLLSRRWQLRLLWEMREGGAWRFRALQDAAGVSPSVLNARLAELTEAGIVALDEDGFALTEDGRALLAALAPLHAWAERWGGRESR